MNGNRKVQSEGVFLIAMVAIGIGVIGWVIPIQIISASQSGVVTITIGNQQQIISQVVTFPKPFGSTPSAIIVTPRLTSFVSNNQPIYSTTLLSSTLPKTWTNMPAGLTEIFGDVNGEHNQFVQTLSLNRVSWSFVCVVGSNTAGAFLKPQYSLDQSTWTDLAGSLNALNIPIDPFPSSLCGLGGAVNVVNSITTSIATNAKNTNIYVRIVGQGGGGIGDNPQFNNIQLTFYSDFYPAFDWGTSGITKNGFTLTVTTFVILLGVQLTIVFDWKAENP